MTKIILSQTHIPYISSLVDDIALDALVDFESVDFESTKELAIAGSIEHLQGILSNGELTPEEKGASIAAIFSYLTLENTILHLDRLKGN